MKGSTKWVATTATGVICILSAVGSVVYNQYLEPKFNDQTVWEANSKIDSNTPLSKDQFHSVLLKNSNVPPTAISNLDDISGKMASQIIPQNTTLTKEDLETNPLVPNATQYIVGINQNWIVSLPGIMRRGDYVDVYLSPPHQTLGSASQSGNSQSQSGLSIINSTPNITGIQPVLTNIPVEFVQNGSNQEVVNAQADQNSKPQETNGLVDRANGSATPAVLDLLVTKGDWQTKLYPKVLQGYQFIFMYSPNK